MSLLSSGEDGSAAFLLEEYPSQQGKIPPSLEGHTLCVRSSSGGQETCVIDLFRGGRASLGGKGLKGAKEGDAYEVLHCEEVCYLEMFEAVVGMVKEASCV